MKDTLFLLSPGFMDGDTGPWFCPETAVVEGMLSFYPRLRAQVDVRYVDFPKPRRPIVALLGEAVQRCPVLVLGDGLHPAPEGVVVGEANGHRYVAREIEICRYLASAYGLGQPHP
jgi:hypothetical protein